jgi:uncharacterized RDD family membrane protein YckC
VRLGLPAHGPGSVAGFGLRLGAYAIDVVPANLLAGVPYWMGFRYDSDARGIVVYLAFLLQAFLLVSLSGQTVGMRMLRIRVIRVRDGGRQSWPWIAGRTLLLGLLVPACIWDRDQRGQHDRAAGTVIVRDGVPTTATPSTGDTPPRP